MALSKDLGEINVRARGTVKDAPPDTPGLAKAREDLARATADLARAEAVAPLVRLEDEDLAAKALALANQVAYAQRQIAAVKAEIERRK